MQNSKNRYDSDINNDDLKVRLRSLIEDGGPNGEKGPALKEALATELGVTSEMIRRYCEAKEFPSIRRLLSIARFFDVSLDYLIGLSDVKNPNAEIKAICEYTGLSEESVEILHHLYESTIHENKRPLHLLNLVLGECKPSEMFPSTSLFTLMDQYITAGAIVRKLDTEIKPQDYETPEQFKAKLEAEEIKRKTVTIESSDEMLEIVSIAELYKERKMQLIRAELERYREESKNGLDKT